MRGKIGFFAGSAIARGMMAAALATGVAVGGMAITAAPALAKEKASKVGDFSKGFQKEAMAFQGEMNKLQPFIEAIINAPANGKAAAMAAAAPTANEIIAKLGPVEAAATSPRDKLTLGGWMRQLGQVSGNGALTQRGAQAIADSGLAVSDKGEAVVATPAQVLDNKFLVLAYADGNKDTATVVRVGEELIAANYSDDQAAEAVARVHVAQKQPEQALAVFKRAVDARQAAGQVPPDAWFQQANRIAFEANLGPQAIEWTQMEVQVHPTAFNWLGAAQMARQFSNFTPQESLDLGRLLFRSGAMQNDREYVEREYVEYIEATMKTGIPQEKFEVATAGVKAGMLDDKADPFVKEALALGAADGAKDRASLPADEKAARASANGISALATGDSYLSFGQAAKAEEMFALAVEKGGIDKDRALTRLGIAQIDQQKYAEAKATLAQVGGVRAPLAKLFWILADQKSKPAA